MSSIVIYGSLFHFNRFNLLFLGSFINICSPISTKRLVIVPPALADNNACCAS